MNPIYSGILGFLAGNAFMYLVITLFVGTVEENDGDDTSARNKETAAFGCRLGW